MTENKSNGYDPSPDQVAPSPLPSDPDRARQLLSNPHGIDRSAEHWVDSLLPPRGFTRDFVHTAVQTSEGHAVFHVHCALALLSAICPTHLAITTFNANVHPTLFAFLVGDPGRSRKSHSITRVQRILTAVASDRLGPNPGSPEAFMDHLTAKQHQLVVYSELGVFFSQTQNGYMAPLKTIYMAGFDGTPLERVTVRKKGIGQASSQKDPRLSILGGIAPALLERHGDELDWRTGFLSRVLFAYESPTCEYGPDEAHVIVDEESIQRQAQKLYESATLAGIGQPKPAIGFTSDIKPFARTFHEEITKYSFSEQKSGIAARSYTLFAKVALLYAWELGYASYEKPWLIPAEAAIPAMNVVRRHLVAARKLSQNLCFTLEERELTKVFNAVGIEPTPLHMILERAFMTKRKTQQYLETLVGMRWINREDLPGVDLTYSKRKGVEVSPDQLREAAKAAGFPSSPQVSAEPSPAPVIVSPEDLWSFPEDV